MKQPMSAAKRTKEKKEREKNARHATTCCAVYAHTNPLHLEQITLRERESFLDVPL
jgi:hypothetical protein